MDLYITDGTVFAGLQVAYNAHLTNCNPHKNNHDYVINVLTENVISIKAQPESEFMR